MRQANDANSYRLASRSPTEKREAALRAAIKLSLVVILGAAIASGLGLFGKAPKDGPATLVNAWGDTVRLDGRGFYRRDSLSGAAQIRANDLVTLFAGVPLLMVAVIAALRGKRGGVPGKGSLETGSPMAAGANSKAAGSGLAPTLNDATGTAGAGATGTAILDAMAATPPPLASPRARLALAGMLGYFLYTYASMALGVVFNELFLLYVLVFSASLLGFVFAMLSIDTDELARRCATSYPRRGVIVLCLLVAAFLGAAWIGGRVLPAYAVGGKPIGIDNYHTLFIQVFDLALVLPAAILGAFWLARRDPKGYLLGTVLVVKGSAMGLAVSAMAVSMTVAGVEVSIVEAAVFPLIFIAAAILAGKALSSVGDRGSDPIGDDRVGPGATSFAPG